MARIDRVRESYEAITEQLFSDKTAFEQYLKFAGKFFKLSSEQTMTIYGTNPKSVVSFVNSHSVPPKYLIVPNSPVCFLSEKP